MSLATQPGLPPSMVQGGPWCQDLQRHAHVALCIVLLCGLALAWPTRAVLLAVFVLCGAGVILLMRRIVSQDAETKRQLAHYRRLSQEQQHRISNGIQSVASSLSLQAAMSGHPDIEEALREAAARLMGVAEVHRRLHDPALAGAGLGQALQGLAERLLASAGLDHVTVQVDAQAPMLEHEAASLVAMIVAEAVANSVKHAFAGRDDGLLAISLRPSPGAKLVLLVSDDGPVTDVPPAAASPGGTSLGMLIMQGLAERLGGGMGLERGAQGGATLRVEFPQTARPG